MKTLLCSTLLLLLGTTSSYKILMFSPTASKSHMISQGRIADELASAGHDVVNFEPDFLDLTDKFVPCQKCRRWPVTGLNNAGYKQIQNDLSEDVFEESSFWSRIFNFNTDPHQDEYNNLCEEIVTNTTLIELLKSENFDAYFGEHVHLCGMGLAHLLNIKHRFWVASCTMGVNTRYTLGIPTPTSHLPFMAPLEGSPASIIQRAKNFILHLAQVRDEMRDNDMTTNMYRKHFGESFPSVEYIAKTSDVMFVSTDVLLEIPSPTLPNVYHIGGLGFSKEKISVLNEKFSKEMEKGKGVILFSLGTIANTTKLPHRVMENVIQVAIKFKDYHFIIKVDRHDKHSFEIGRNIPNVLIVDWVPQTSLLNHPRLEAFITHAGYNSLMESAFAGVPVISIPFMFDQPRNGRSVAKKGWGILRSKHQLANNPSSIEDAIEEILTNRIYKQKAMRLKKLMESKPQSASQTLIETTEWVLKNEGVEELQYEGKHFNIIVYYNIDVIALFTITLVAFCLIVRLSFSKVAISVKTKTE